MELEYLLIDNSGVNKMFLPIRLSIDEIFFCEYGKYKVIDYGITNDNVITKVFSERIEN